MDRDAVLKVERFDVAHYGEAVVLQFDGRYVRHSDYSALVERCAGLEKVSDELSMLLRMFVHSHRKAAPGNTLCDKALDYMRRNGLEGSILRTDEAAIAKE